MTRSTYPSNSAAGDTIVRAWHEAAAGYATYFEPRFRPWIEDAVASLQAISPPPGVAVVPGCGAGQELPLLAEALPRHRILALDPAPGMCAQAQARTRDLPDVTVRCEDAAGTGQWPSPCTAILSCFVLQLLPDPEPALATWVRALEPGGGLSIVYWPAEIETDGPFAAIRQVLETRLPPRDHSWEQQVEAAVERAGGRILQHRRVTHSMHHPSPERLWTAMTQAGPLRPLLLTRGEAFMAEARRSFLAAVPGGALTHEPAARLLLVRRDP